ncbi:MAG: hypothetical protein JWM11_7943 [Planctomycetaceae bacterium]|nr:hypothetical protein [Planctomycetaceae bacterium]
MSTKQGRNAGQTESQPEEAKIKGDPPVWSRRYRGAGAFLDIAVFQKEITGDNGTYSVFNVKLTRSYKDGDAWKETSNLRSEDLPIVAAGLLQAYDFVSSELNRG